MAVYKTAQGKTIDMAALAAKNQKTRAVGNMKVNARGDTIDSFGRVIQPVTEKATNNYSKTVGNRSAHATRPPAVRQQPKAPPPRPQPDIVAKPVKEELTDYEKELNIDLEEEDALIEEVKSKENKDVK